MATERAPWTKKIFDILSDGEWHDIHKVIHLAMPLVPPGRAERQGEKNRVRDAERRGCNPGVRTRGDAIVAGQYTITAMSLWPAIRRGAIEREGNLIRLPRQEPTYQAHSPECETRSTALSGAQRAS